MQLNFNILMRTSRGKSKKRVDRVIDKNNRWSIEKVHAESGHCKTRRNWSNKPCIHKLDADVLYPGQFKCYHVLLMLFLCGNVVSDFKSCQGSLVTLLLFQNTVMSDLNLSFWYRSAFFLENLRNDYRTSDFAAIIRSLIVVLVVLVISSDDWYIDSDKATKNIKLGLLPQSIIEFERKVQSFSSWKLMKFIHAPWGAAYQSRDTLHILGCLLILYAL